MKRFRFTIRGGAAIVLVVALGLFVLRNLDDPLVSQSLITIAVVTVIGMFPMAMACRGRIGAFLTGFAIAGGLYLVLCQSTYGKFLPTESLAKRLAERWFPVIPDRDAFYDERWEEQTIGLRRHANLLMAYRALSVFGVGTLVGTAAALIVAKRVSFTLPDPPDGSLIANPVSRTSLENLWSNSSKDVSSNG